MLEKQIKVIEKFKQVHGDLYDYSLVEYKNSKEKVIIICREHGEFLQSPGKHIHGKNGCPSCGRLKTQASSTYTQDEILHRFKEVHRK